MEDPDPLEQLIEGVADGTLDRQRLPGTHRDPSISQLLAELQVLAGINDVHGSDAASEDSTQPPVPRPAELRRGALASGDKWGNFELLRQIGEGSFGEVYLARDLWLGHDVALKVLRASVTDRAKMLHEARMLVRVRHPHVVTVHGADVHHDRLGFWMDFVDGVTLHEAIARDGRRSAGEAMAWGQELCRALAAVHAAGIVHRDVKAQNVMRRTGDGQLVLMDFGAGEMLDAPRLGGAAGTPLYLAPELLDGAAATRSSDIYALGVLLFYVVSRQFPLQAATWDELILAHERGARVRLEDIRPDLPPAFVDVVERALHRNPAARYGSAGELLADLRGAALETGPLHVTPPVPVPPPPKPTPPWLQALVRVGTAVSGLLAVALLLGFVASGTFRVFLRVPEQFDSAGFSLSWGIRPLVPVIFYWSYLLLVLATLIGLAMVAGALVSQIIALVRPRAYDAAAAARTGGIIGTAAFVVGSIGWFALTWSQSTWPLAAMALGIAWTVGLPLLTVAAGSMSAPPRVREMADATGARRVSALLEPTPNAIPRAAAIFSLAAASWLLVVWGQLGVFRGLVALGNLPLQGVDVGQLFAPLTNTSQRLYVQAWAYLSFALAFAIWYVRRVEPAGSFEPVRLMRWSLMLLFALTLTMTAIPYRIAWQDFERVDYAGTRAFIVGETADEYHLFFPPSTGVVGHNVPRNDARLTHSGVYEKLFVERLGQ